MKLILIDAVEHLGLPGDVVNVKPGYARNFLVPAGKALVATEGNVREREHQRRIAEGRRRKLVQSLSDRAAQLAGQRVEFEERVSASGRLYGSVTGRRVAELLNEKFGNIQAHWVKLGEPIKQAGEYAVDLVLAPEVKCTLTVVVHGVVAEETPAAPAESAEAADAQTAAADVDDAAGEEGDTGEDEA